MNIEDLENRCKYWQDLLGLAHWDIETKVVQAAEIDCNCSGQIDYSITEEKSLIRIKSPEDNNGYFPLDIEQVLVHELLHIVFAHSTGEINTLHEQALNRIARLLVYLNRALETFAPTRQA